MFSDKEKSKKGQCSECKQWLKEVDEENDMCKKCVSKYEMVNISNNSSLNLNY